MIDSAINTFTKGLNRDVSPSKYSSENYYDALNVKIVSDEPLNHFSITNEKGNTNVFNVPDVGPVYSLTCVGTAIKFVLSLDTSSAFVVSHLYNLPSGWTYEMLYNQMVVNYAVQIAAGHFKVVKTLDRIIFVSLKSDIDTLTVANVTGTSTVSTVLPSLHNLLIIGGCQLRDYLVVMTVGTPTADSTSVLSNGQLWRLEIEEGGTVDGILAGNMLDPSVHLIYNNALNFSTGHRIEAYSNYESSEVGKVYFTDNNNNFRHVNIFDTNLFALQPYQLELMPNVSFGDVTILSVDSSGNYKSGMVQYAYQYYNVHGAQTVFSNPTGLIHLTKSPETLANTKTYFGTAVDEKVGKSVSLKISDLDRSFTNVRVVAIYYEKLDGSPVISVIRDTSVPTTGDLYLTDAGDTLGKVLSEDEFISIGSLNFKCKSFDVKDNILFPANIEESFYDVDEEDGYWDARAYRWNKKASPEARLASSDGTTLTLDSFTDALTVPEEHDCIQVKNDQRVNYVNPLLSYTYTYHNQRLGGEGTNIKYYFDVEALEEDSVADTLTEEYATLSNGVFPNYANPLMQATKLGYMRDEVYRFGVVFKKESGAKSFVKWIADIKMPEIHEVDTDWGQHSNGQWEFKTFSKGNGKTSVHALSVIFEIKNLPASAESFEIVRVKREEWDKSILMQGILSPCRVLTNSYYNPAQTVGILAAAGGVKIHQFISPEVSFLRKIVQSGELQIVACGNKENYLSLPLDITKVDNLQIVTNQLYQTTPIIESQIIPPGQAAKYVINGMPFQNYRYGGSSTTIAGYGGSHLVVTTNDTITYNAGLVAGGFNDGVALTNIVHSLSSQYGGNTYSDRSVNKYMPCYQEQSENLGTTTVQVYGGDTFIGHFNCLYGAFDNAGGSTTFNSYAALTFPVETSINLALRHDISSPFRNTGLSYYYQTQEVAGTYNTTLYGTHDFAQQTDLYLYNTVYSKQSDIIPHFPKPINFSNNKVFDTRILSSNPKIRNEEVDSWLSYFATNYIDVDSTYGPINKVKVHKQRLYFFQDKGVGWASVNERSLLNNQETTLSLGKGGILDQYFYTSRHSGSKHQFSVLESPAGMYYYDAVNNRINILNEEQSSPVSELKGFSSYLKQMGLTGIRKTDSSLTGLGVHGVYDSRFNRLIWTFNDHGYADEFTISYNELLQAFESFYSFKPQQYLKFDDFIYSTDPSDKSLCYLHNAGNYGEFYGNYYDSEIEILVNKDPYRVKAFTNLEYVLNTIPEANRNFETLRVYNNYQDTGSIALTSSNTNKRMRQHRITIGRNNNSDAVSDRIRSEYALARLSYDNFALPNLKFSISNIVTYYMSNSL